jgi:hypothetical protein
MRKVTLIAGITGLVLITIGTYLVISKIQPHGGLLIIGLLEFWLVFLPMLLIYRLKNDQTGFQKATTVFGFIVGWLILFPGLFFSIMRYPGGAFLNLIGMFLGVIFLVLFIVSNRANFLPAIKGIFTILVAAIFVAMAGGRQLVLAQKHDEIEKNYAEYDASINEKKQLDAFIFQAMTDMMKSENDSVTSSAAYNFQDESEKIEEDLEKIKDELVGYSQMIDQHEARNFPVHQLDKPGDYDTPTHYMIGVDPANVTGKSKDIRMMLMRYQKEVLPQEIHLDINFDDVKSENDNMISWERSNFYHATIIDALTKITNLQIAVLKAEKEAFDKKIFSRK